MSIQRSNLPEKLLYDRWVGGVCGGLARFFGIESGMLRLVYAIGLLVGPLQFELFVLYLFLWLVLPKQSYFAKYD